MREAKLANEVNKKFVFVVYPHCQVATDRQLLHLLGVCIQSTPALRTPCYYEHPDNTVSS